jgi:hypothetical protein
MTNIEALFDPNAGILIGSFDTSPTRLMPFSSVVQFKDFTNFTLNTVGN